MTNTQTQQQEDTPDTYVELTASTLKSELMSITLDEMTEAKKESERPPC
ncbi:MAG TPA: hypothetical protein ACQGQI_08335 [Xylella sp.]